MKISDKINLTNSAIDFITELKNVNRLSENYLFRIKCEGAIGAPFTYSFGFDLHENENDKVFEFDDLKIVLDAKSFENMKGSHINYSVSEEGLVIDNPLANYKCGGSCKTH